MSNLTPSLVGLDKGLNLQTAKIVAPAGSVLDTLNYEQVDFQGQKRIDGFTRYDGSALADIHDYYKIGVIDSSAMQVADFLVTAEDALIGLIVGVEAGFIYLHLMNETLAPQVGDTIHRRTGAGVGAGTDVASVVLGAASGATVQDHYDKVLEFTAVLRDQVGGLPGAVAGLHWFRDRLYAVADMTAVSLSGTTPAIYPNDRLSFSSSMSFPFVVADSFIRDNTRLIFINNFAAEAEFTQLWQTEGTTIYRDGVSIGTVANGFENLTVADEFATIFESRSEAQAQEEDGNPYYYGWRGVHHGWSINFADGVSLYGSLPSLNQNIKGIGIQGPTSVVGDNGRPLVVTQKVSITNEPTQVNGWKNSQSPTSYTLESDNLIDVDGITIYADAYISWDGATGVVTGVTDTLAEYPASSTVVIEL